MEVIPNFIILFLNFSLSLVEMEISIVPLYQGQTWLLAEILQYMKEKGFTLVSIVPAFTDHKTGKVLQCNGIFFRDQ
jgi:hypothetical protein